MFDHLFANIKFEESNHTYTANGQKLKNVTALVNKAKKPFEAEYWAKRKAAERGISPEQILKEWDDKRLASQELGTSIHRYIQQVLLGAYVPPADPFTALNKTIPHLYHFDQLWAVMKPDNQVIKVEWVIGDENIGIAGMADLLLFNQQTCKYHLFDWKSNERFKLDNRFQTLLYPWQDLDECELNIYSLQTSIYRLIIERASGVTLGDSYIVHLTGGGYQVHRALDLRKRCERWLPTVI